METALALGTLVLVTAAAVAAVAAVVAGVRCTDAARELARQAARGDTDRGRSAAAALAPTGAESELRIDGDVVVATVRARPVALLPIPVSGSATAVVEPGLSADGVAGTPPPLSPMDPTGPADGPAHAPADTAAGTPPAGPSGAGPARPAAGSDHPSSPPVTEPVTGAPSPVVPAVPPVPGPGWSG